MCVAQGLAEATRAILKQRAVCEQGWRFAWPERIWQNPFSGVAGWQLWNLFRDHEVPKDKQGQVRLRRGLLRAAEAGTDGVRCGGQVGLMQKRFVGEHVTIRFPDEESAEVSAFCALAARCPALTCAVLLCQEFHTAINARCAPHFPRSPDFMRGAVWVRLDSG